MDCKKLIWTYQQHSEKTNHNQPQTERRNQRFYSKDSENAWGWSDMLGLTLQASNL